ncbi:MAG: DUF3299 domain-containing protein [Pseudomonadota bacterium]
MINLLRSLLLILLLTSVGLASQPRIVEWDELMPPGYLDSLIELMSESSFSITNIFSFDDDTEEAQNAYEQMQDLLNSAPIVPELNNQDVKIAGFVVPLDFDFDTETFQSFLLVPYFGACIHTPPPPSNQIVYVTSDKRLNQELLDYAVWASGKLSTESKENLYGVAGYSMENATLEEYIED